MNKTKYIQIRVTEKEKEEIQKYFENKNVSNFLRKKLLTEISKKGGSKNG